jgi:hypothetical protein
MVERNGEVGEADVAFGAAADGQPVALDTRGADDLAPFRAVRNLPKKEGHRRRLTNRRRR